MKILVVEDEHELSDAICQSLARDQYVVETAADFHSAHEKLGSYEYDCILLDIMLPGGSGLELLRELKAAGKSDNVIIISARDSIEDKIEGLELGADDYLAKPFHLAELNARVKAVLRRNVHEGKNSLALSNVELNITDRTLAVDGNLLPLNRKEFDILHYFMLNKNRLVTKTALAEHVWGDNIDQSDNFDFIYAQMKNLRKKLQDANAAIEFESVYGTGYKLLEK